MRYNNRVCDNTTVRHISWCRRSLSRYICWAHWENVAYMRVHFKIRLKNGLPIIYSNLFVLCHQQHSSRWKYVILGCLKAISFVLLRFKCTGKQFAAAQASMWLNYSVSVCSGTSNVVLSAYLNIPFNSDKAHRLDFITIYKVGPIPEPWTVLMANSRS